MIKRNSGILLHITSLPGREGIGTMGKNAFAWIDFLRETSQQLWQILPLGPVAYGNCPYQCYSAFAGNPLLIDLHQLGEEGVLEKTDLQNIPRFDIRQVDFGKVTRWKMPLLKKAFLGFRDDERKRYEGEYARFCDEHNWWLADYALFMAIREALEGQPWNNWPEGIKRREPAAMNRYREELGDTVAFHYFLQFFFFRQWYALREYARQNGVTIIGDVPLYVAGNSVDVWANTGIFLLDRDLNPLKVAGVPPDYFSTTGQLWGSPVYDWESLRRQEYHWWLARIHFNLRMFDQVRIDHFRGLEAFWSVPVGEETAIHGEWVTAKGSEMLEILRKQLGSFPLIAEDLGTITPEVEQLRDRFNMPGMKVLQFAFNSDEANEHLPHNFPVNAVVYTGTHDNDTAWGWLHAAPEKEKKFAMKYLKNYPWRPVWGLIEMAWASVACKAVTPLQDLLELGAESRMNIPGIAQGNWGWRFRWDQIRGKHRRFLREITGKYNRTA
ncbi:MAG: 4-alpha-glucanotransferase [Bacteroidota bacterium]|jgi:4-alpha-glucanotransferase|nr:4-alpha-glucanotransferase [Prolixibacteraceae bacterium]MDI9565008.1 4-alpha-glucanotransferase [Bacteroidota bacterium]NLT00315.1 4-alpha-glucanotransferase [Bacteroidales bacterium]OQB81039.1 MAG: 4-alpha-glucanotransferase [Bacteroidetes bacterium ADurb.Bin123]HNU76808.1 4-alpha-glucanotransferase [Prolixibacteraceae bacterium]